MPIHERIVASADTPGHDPQPKHRQRKDEGGRLDRNQLGHVVPTILEEAYTTPSNKTLWLGKLDITLRQFPNSWRWAPARAKARLDRTRPSPPS